MWRRYVHVNALLQNEIGDKTACFNGIVVTVQDPRWLTRVLLGETEEVLQNLVQDVLALASARVAPEGSRAMIRQQVEAVAVMRGHSREGALIIDSDIFHRCVSQMVMMPHSTECTHITHFTVVARPEMQLLDLLVAEGTVFVEALAHCVLDS
jgi:hypothetical protein